MNSTVTKENIPCQYFYIFNSHLSSGAGGFADKMKTNPSSCDYLMLDLSKHKNMIFGFWYKPSKIKEKPNYLIKNLGNK